MEAGFQDQFSIVGHWPKMQKNYSQINSSVRTVTKITYALLIRSVDRCYISFGRDPENARLWIAAHFLSLLFRARSFAARLCSLGTGLDSRFGPGKESTKTIKRRLTYRRPSITRLAWLAC